MDAPNSSRHRRRSTGLCRRMLLLKATAVTLFKIANDMGWLGSGPRAGLMGNPIGQRTGLIDHAWEGQPKSGRVDADDLHRGHGL